MKKYLCEACGYIYDPEVGDPDNGVEAGTAFEGRLVMSTVRTWKRRIC